MLWVLVNWACLQRWNPELIEHRMRFVLRIVEAMRAALDSIAVSGRVVIGEGEQGVRGLRQVGLPALEVRRVQYGQPRGHVRRAPPRPASS